MRWIKTVNITDIKNEEIFSLDLEGREIMLIKKNTEVFALDRICTHERADLSMGFLSEDSVTCPLHLSQFEFETGNALNPPAEGSLKSYKVKIEENVIYILVD